MKEIHLNEEGQAFLKSFLMAGNLLAKEASMVVTRGKIRTWLPDDVYIDQISLQDGWKESASKEDFWRPLYEIVSRFLSKSVSHIAVAEAFVEPAEAFANTENHETSSDRGSYFTCVGADVKLFDALRQQKGPADVVSVFSFLQGHTSTKVVEDFIDDAFPYHQVYVLTTLQDGRVMSSGTSVTRDYLRNLAEHADYVAVGAYDGSGVVIWEKDHNDYHPA